MTDESSKRGRVGMPRNRPKVAKGGSRRCKKKPEDAESPFLVLADSSSTKILDGKRQRISEEDALKLRIYQRAIEGSPLDAKTVLDWIHQRDEARPSPRRRIPQIRTETSNYRNVDRALQLLGIAVHLPHLDFYGRPGLQLETDLVNQALAMMERPLTARGMRSVQQQVGNPDALRWPELVDE